MLQTLQLGCLAASSSSAACCCRPCRSTFTLASSRPWFLVTEAYSSGIYACGFGSPWPQQQSQQQQLQLRNRPMCIMCFVCVACRSVECRTSQLSGAICYLWPSSLRCVGLKREGRELASFHTAAAEHHRACFLASTVKRVCIT
jgi:hypothetical protein